MSPNEFDRFLMEDLSQLPPAPGEVGELHPLARRHDKNPVGHGADHLPV